MKIGSFPAFTAVRACDPEVGLSLAGIANYLSNVCSDSHRPVRTDDLSDELEEYLQEYPIAAGLKIGLELTGERLRGADLGYIRLHVVQAIERRRAEVEAK